MTQTLKAKSDENNKSHNASIQYKWEKTYAILISSESVELFCVKVKKCYMRYIIGTIA